MEIIVGLCLLAILLVVLYVVIQLVTLKGIKRLRYLKNFKKGQAFIVYLLILPVLWVGLNYVNENSVLDNFFNAVKLVTDLISLKFNTGADIVKLMKADLYYSITMYTFYVVILLNSLLFFFSFFGQIVINYFRYVCIRLSRRELNIVIEYNKNNMSIIKSLKNKIVIVYGNLKPEEKDELFVKKVIYRDLVNPKELRKLVCDGFKNLKKRKTNVFINTSDDSSNLLYTKQFVEIIEKLNLKEGKKEDVIGNLMDIYTFGQPTNESAFTHFAEVTKGCVHHLNKYKLIAIDFIDKYPLTHFMDDTILNHEDGTIRVEYDKNGNIVSDIDINMVIVGFGKTSQQLFLTSTASQQFITKNHKGEVIPKPVNYYCYDSQNGKESNKILNHTFNRYVHELKKIKENHLENEYLELPDVPANLYPMPLDIHSSRFNDSLYKILKDVKKDKNSPKSIKKYNYILISFGTDLENLDLAEKLLQRIKEWNLKDSTRIFVKIRSSSIINNVISKDRLENKDYYLYSGEEDVVYNANKIINEKIEKMARMRNELYTIEEYATETDYDLDDNEVLKLRKDALEKWYSRSEIERFSNIYACLSIRSKLNMFNFDYVSIKDKRKRVPKDQFYKEYEKGFPRVTTHLKKGRFEKDITKYEDLNYIDSLRTNMAIQEHNRWNAYMISMGMTPSSIEEIKASSSNGRDYSVRKHYLTTMKGLVEFRKIKAKKYNSTELKEDVIKYDYQILDDIYWLLEKNNLKIVRLDNN